MGGTSSKSRQELVLLYATKKTKQGNLVSLIQDPCYSQEARDKLLQTKDKDGTPLIVLACKSMNPGGALALIEAGAPVYATDINGCTALHFMAIKPASPQWTRILNRLLDCNADPLAVNSRGWNVYHEFHASGNYTLLRILEHRTCDFAGEVLIEHNNDQSFFRSDPWWKDKYITVTRMRGTSENAPDFSFKCPRCLQVDSSRNYPNAHSMQCGKCGQDISLPVERLATINCLKVFSSQKETLPCLEVDLDNVIVTRASVQVTPIVQLCIKSRGIPKCSATFYESIPSAPKNAKRMSKQFKKLIRLKAGDSVLRIATSKSFVFESLLSVLERSFLRSLPGSRNDDHIKPPADLIPVAEAVDSYQGQVELATFAPPVPPPRTPKGRESTVVRF